MLRGPVVRVPPQTRMPAVVEEVTALVLPGA
ncbi:hypothetical protein GA0115246_115814 [Streptomyces sp. SolWspMP-sol7th]|nr:hypothetical protein GA0115246_115814 [Streptomyces sp. SolWspMP-sol7th]